MKLSVKAGVLFQPLTPQMVLANQIVTYVFDQFGWPTIITSGSDGVHNGAPVAGDTVDPHYVGKALDYRTVALGIPDAIITAIAAALRVALGTQYAVIKESSHLHVQFGRPLSAASRLAAAQLTKLVATDPFA